MAARAANGSLRFPAATHRAATMAAHVADGDLCRASLRRSLRPTKSSRAIDRSIDRLVLSQCEAEVMHARVAMLAAVGYLVGEARTLFSCHTGSVCDII